MSVAAVCFALASLQGAAQLPTVGDTIWVRRAVRLPPRYTARAPIWEPEGDIELLGHPELTLRADSAILRYPLVAWTPGIHTVEIPSPTLLAPDGAIDSLAPATVRLQVASVLPDLPDSAIAPQPGASIVARPSASLLPLVLLGVAALAVLAPLHWWWRRRGKPLPPAPSPEPTPVPVERWAGAGEARSVLALAAARLRGAIRAADPDAHEGLDTASCIVLLRERHPEWPVAGIEETLRAIDAMRFAPGTSEDALALHRHAEALAARVGGGA
ncbi:MAG TPA: hypothetical protein VFT04_08825 [Gemmatimonadales bacterium]|nr:hypothetical protein [Gemmatimonadales bacterium]